MSVVFLQDTDCNQCLPVKKQTSNKTKVKVIPFHSSQVECCHEPSIFPLLTFTLISGIFWPQVTIAGGSRLAFDCTEICVSISWARLCPLNNGLSFQAERSAVFFLVVCLCIVDKTQVFHRRMMGD